MSDNFTYEQPRRMSRRELEAAFQSGDGEKIGTALIAATYTENGAWILDWCVKFVDHQDGVARYSVALTLSAMSFMEESESSLVKCREIAERLCNDPDESVRVAARDALEDVLQASKSDGAS